MDNATSRLTIRDTRPTVAMLMYPGMTMLDLIGPHEALSHLTEVHLVATSLDTMASDSGVPFRASTAIADAPADVDVLFVPGGDGSVDAMRNTEILDYLADRGARARFVTSVCTGSLILGAAGLLQGYKATSYWACRHLLRLFGAQPSDARVVVDRNRITGGGVTAGIDFGPTLLAEMLGDDAAKITQLRLEYDPNPPFNNGSPSTAAESAVEAARQRLGPFNQQVEAAARELTP
jgi:cyclohexyl-isocyanide hydratase